MGDIKVQAVQRTTTRRFYMNRDGDMTLITTQTDQIDPACLQHFSINGVDIPLDSVKSLAIHNTCTEPLIVTHKEPNT